MMNFSINTAAAYMYIKLANGKVIQRPVNVAQDGSIASQNKLYDYSQDAEAMTLTIDGKAYNFGGWVTEKSQVLASPPIIRYSRTKKIVSTSTNSGEEVIEQWTTYGYELYISGILVDTEEHIYPGKQIQELCKIFESNKIATVEGQIFKDLNITDIYIHRIDIEGLQGFMDTFRYTMEAKSVKPLTFSLKN